ncbi:MAG: hypothetical protein ACREA9_21865, partial [Pyrinomonadaceae bacterium]
IIELMRSIGENDYFEEEPLLVIRKSGRPISYTVVEGNRRLAASKLLAHPNLAPIRRQAVLAAHDEAKHNPTRIPVLVYERREDILDYLGYRHITGIKPWDPLAKAKYLHQLRLKVQEKTPEKEFDTLARIIGSNASYVARLLTGLSLFEKIEANEFYHLKGVKTEDDIDFSLLTTALTYSNIVKFLGLKSSADPSLKSLVEKHLRELVQWVFERGPDSITRVGESRDLRKLNAVVNNNDALKAFRRGAPLDDATLLTGLPAEVFRTAIAKAKSHLQYARNYVHKVEDLSDADIEDLLDIERLANFLGNAITPIVSNKTAIHNGLKKRVRHG